jgi:hypothetical protein
MNIDCPHCGKNNEIDGDDLSPHCSEDEGYECKYCEHEFKIGWYAEVELR